MINVRTRAGLALLVMTAAAGLFTAPFANATQATPADLEACVSNGGDKVLCCARYGGDYTQEGTTTTTPSGVTVYPADVCIFQNGMRVAFSSPTTPTPPKKTVEKVQTVPVQARR